jgi:hypothetical protein
MRRHVALTIGLCLLPLGLVTERASAQAATTLPAGSTEDAWQDAQQPAPPSTNTTVKERQAQPRERTPTPPKDERAPQPRTPSAGLPPGVIDPMSHAGPNVRIELTLTDQRTGSPTTNKTVMLTTSNQNWGRLRSEVSSVVYGSAPLNVDARPIVLGEGKISVQLTIEYSQGRIPDAESNPEKIAQVRINESLTALLEDGKPLVITQSAEPTSDRKVTVEVKATVLK